MISFVAVTMLSFLTLCLGTLLAERLEQRRAACHAMLEGRERQRAEQ